MYFLCFSSEFLIRAFSLKHLGPEFLHSLNIGFAKKHFLLSVTFTKIKGIFNNEIEIVLLIYSGPAGSLSYGNC